MALPPLRWFGAADVVAAMPPLEERLRLAELTMTALARPAASQLPPKIAIHPRPTDSFVHAMPAHLRGATVDDDLVGMKWVAGYATNNALGIASISAVVVLNDPETGVPVAMLDGGPITAQRTAAISGLAIRRFGPDARAGATPGGTARHVAIIGAGVQGRSHLEVLGGVLPGMTLHVFDASPERAAALADAARATAGIAGAEPHSTARGAVEAAEVIVTAASFGPAEDRQVMTNAWLGPDATVVPIDYATYCAAEVAREAALFLVDQREQFLANRDAGNFEGYPDPLATIGEAILDGTPRPAGRVVITHLGVGLADLVFADAIVRAATTAGLGDYASALREVGMRLVGRLIVALIRLVIVLLILAIVGLIAMGAITTQRGWAQTTGTIKLAGLIGPVTVTRDAYGIIQITANDTHDLFEAQGYVHAQERMWQMEISRRIGAGRLSELFGSDEIATDSYIRTLGWRQAAQRDLDAMSPDSIAILQAYSDGVNAWIKEHNGRLSTSFVVTGLKSGLGGIGGYPLEPWTPLDTATWQKVQAWSLGGNVDSEIFRLLADERLGSPAKTDELFPPYDPTAPVITPTGLVGSGGAGAPPSKAGADATTATADPAVELAAAHLTDANAAALTDIGNLHSMIASLAGLDRGDGLVGDHGVGSNNWVVSGARTESGKPILANDPHLGFAEPSIWIMNGLHCSTVGAGCPWDVIGVSFPGAPGVVLGHNDNISWGATNVGPDTEDLFLETPDPSDPAARYMYQGAAVPYQIRHETIKVAGGPDVQLDVRSTRHGVVLSDVDTRLMGGPILALSWTTTAQPDTALETFFKIDTATNFDEFKAAFDGYGSPSQNFIYADTKGHIGYVLPGLIPIRAGGCPSDVTDGVACTPNVGGDRVRDGASGLNEWTGYIPRDQLPWQLDPAGGQIVSANNEAVDAKYPNWLGDEWDPGYRAARISQLLAQIPGKITADDMRSIELDTHVGRADTIIPELQSLAVRPATADGQLLWDRIIDWNRSCDVDSVGCAAYITTEVALQRAIFDDELGPLARDYVGSTMAWQAVIAVLHSPTSSWWKNTTNASASSDPEAVAAAAIDDTAAQLRAAFGDPANWTWGRLHTVQFKESTLGTSPLFGWYFNGSARPVAGADGAIDNTYYQISRAYPDPADPSYVPVGIKDLYSVTNGPSYRFTVDMSDLDGARIIITTGQSGNPFDTHYGDLIPTWIAGGTLPLPFSPGNVAASAVTTLTLSP